MAGLRAYHPFPVPANATELTLSPAESSHLVRSLRARPDEALEAFDGAGRVWRGTVLHAQPNALTMRIKSAETYALPHPRLALAQALPKAGLMDDIIRAAVELGTSEIHPLLTRHCEVKLDAARAASRLERWHSIAIEACKQSGNPFLPRIHPPEALKTWLPKIEPHTLAFVGSLESGVPPLAHLAPPGEAIETLLILIGPEGDFSLEEYASIREQGVRGVRFGSHVLRVPTAAHYALVALDQLRQRMVPA